MIDPRVLLRPHPALNGHTSYLAIELATWLREALDRELREVGMTWPDFLVLTMVNAVGPVCQEAISDRTGVDRSTLSNLARDLEYEGLLDRRRGGLDGRKVECIPTDGGAEAAAEAARAVQQAERMVLRDLHSKERARLHVLLTRAPGGREREARVPVR